MKKSTDSNYGGGTEHTKNASKAKADKHDKGRARNDRDKGGDRYRTQDSKKKKTNTAMRNELLGKVITAQVRNGGSFDGILAGTGLKWILLKYIPNDYIVDGFVVINTNYISKIEISEDDVFKEYILKLKSTDFSLISRFNLDITDQLIVKLKSKNRLISLELKNHHKNYVGQITLIRPKSMRLQLIDKRCNPLKEETFLYSELRAIYFDDDYLNSLILVSNFKTD